MEKETFSKEFKTLTRKELRMIEGGIIDAGDNPVLCTVHCDNGNTIDCVGVTCQARAEQGNCFGTLYGQDGETIMYWRNC